MVQGEAGDIGRQDIIVYAPVRQIMIDDSDETMGRDIVCITCSGVACASTACILCPFPFNIVWGAGVFIATKMTVVSRAIRRRF